MEKPAPSGSRFAPLWQANPSSGPALQEFVTGARYDCVVIGAGITGCSAALHLAELGSRVCVLDALAPGAGTSGRANGQVMAELTLSPDSIIKRYGASRGEDVLRVTGSAPDLVFDLISRHGIDCEARRAGWIEGTPWRWGMRSLEKRVKSWQRRGAPVALLGADSMKDLVGTDVYVGGIHDRRAGTLNPLAYTQGLAAAAVRAGAVIHDAAEALELVEEPGGWRVVTAKGSVTAATVIAATNAYTGRLLPNLRLPVLCV